MPRRATLLLVLLAALVAAAAARADKVAFTAADQKTAHAIVLKAADFGAGWKGRAVKPDLSSSKLDCPSLKGKEPVLVATGAAETDYSNRLVDVDSEAEVVKSAAMVAADYRYATLPGVVACLRSKAPGALGKTTRVVSIGRLAVARVTPLTAAFRFDLSVRTNGKDVRVLVDLLFVGKGRTELTLTTTAPAAVRSTVQAAELRLARLMASRTPAS